jgi:hypothetical protein
MAISVDIGSQVQVVMNTGVTSDYTFAVIPSQRATVDVNGIITGVLSGLAIVVVTRITDSKIVDRITVKVNSSSEDNSSNHPHRSRLSTSIDSSIPTVTSFTASWALETLSIAYSGAADIESGVSAVKLSVVTTDNSSTLASNLIVTNTPSLNYSVPKNGKTYNVTLKVINNNGLQYVNTIPVVIPGGYGSGGYGRSGYGR